MPTFTYQAKDGQGQTVSGEVVASDERMAAGRVRELGYYPMRVQPGAPGVQTQTFSGADTARSGSAAASLPAPTPGWRPQTETFYDPTSSRAPQPGQLYSNGEPATVAGSWFERTFIYPIWTGVAPRDLSLFYRQFAALSGAGLGLSNALRTLQDQTSGRLRRIAWQMNRHVQAGGKLSEAMSMFPHVFTRLQRAIIATSEETGMIDVMMMRLSEYIEADYALRQMIRRETFMPKINFAATFLIPTLVIAVMHGVGDYFRTAVLPLLLIVAAMFAVYLAGRFALTIRPIAIAYDTIKSFLPYFGKTVRMLSLAKFARAFASLYAGGVLVPRAVQTAATVAGNEYLSARMDSAVADMMAGGGLTDAFARSRVFPPMFLSMVSTGETTGNLDGMLNKVAEFYESESALRLHQSVTVLNVVIFLIVAAIVGYDVVRFYSGYYNSILNMANP